MSERHVDALVVAHGARVCPGLSLTGSERSGLAALSTAPSAPRAPQAKGGYFYRSEGGIWQQRYLPMTSFQALVKTNLTTFLLTDLFTSL